MFLVAILLHICILFVLIGIDDPDDRDGSTAPQQDLKLIDHLNPFETNSCLDSLNFLIFIFFVFVLVYRTH